MMQQEKREGIKMRDESVTLEGYIVRRTTEKAIGIVKEDAGIQGGDLIWIPRSCCADGESIETGDTDLECALWKAEAEGLDF
jgi:hypothetical protein